MALTEGPWCDEAYASAVKQARRFLPRVLDYTQMVPPPVSRGAYPQQVAVGPNGLNDNNSPTPPPAALLDKPAVAPEAIPPPPPLEPQGQASPSPFGRGQG